MTRTWADSTDGLDWSPLALTDPVPGDPVAVSTLAAEFAATARQLDAQRAALLRLAGDVDEGRWTGVAARAFGARLGPVPGDLDRARARFEQMAAALAEFAPALEAAQRQARAALAMARRQQVESAVHAHSASSAQSASVPGWDLLDQPHLAPARHALARACAERDAAAGRCVRALHIASQDRLSNPGRWHRLISHVSQVCGLAATWLGVLAFVLMVAAPGLGEVVGAVALVAGLIQMLADADLVAQYGEGSWGNVAWDGVSALPVSRAASGGAALTRASVLVRAGERLSRTRTLPRAVQAGARGIDRALAGPRGFGATRGWHGARASGFDDPAAGLRDFRVATAQLRTGPGRWGRYFRSSGGVLDDLSRARAQGPGAVAWMAGGQAWDLGTNAVSVGQAFGVGPGSSGSSGAGTR